MTKPLQVKKDVRFQTKTKAKGDRFGRIEDIRKDNWLRINKLMELRQKQFEDLYRENWWHYLIEDELYKHLCQKLVEIKMMGRPTFLVKKELSEEDIKSLSSGCITVKEFIERKTYD